MCSGLIPKCATVGRCYLSRASDLVVGDMQDYWCPSDASVVAGHKFWRSPAHLRYDADQGWQFFVFL